MGHKVESLYGPGLVHESLVTIHSCFHDQRRSVPVLPTKVDDHRHTEGRRGPGHVCDRVGSLHGRSFHSCRVKRLLL